MIRENRGAALAASLLLCASAAQATITLKVEGTVTSLDRETCLQSTGPCTDTTTAISPLATSYSVSFASRFDDFEAGSHTTPSGDTTYSSSSSQFSLSRSTDYAHDLLAPGLPPLNLTAQQFAAGTNSQYDELSSVAAGKTLRTHADGSVFVSSNWAVISASQEWSTTTSDGVSLWTSRGIDVYPYDLHVTQTPADVALPVSVDTMASQMLAQFESGGAIGLDLSFDTFDSTTGILEYDDYEGSGLIVSLTTDTSPVPEPKTLWMVAAALLAGGFLSRRARADRAWISRTSG